MLFEESVGYIYDMFYEAIPHSFLSLFFISFFLKK